LVPLAEVIGVQAIVILTLEPAGRQRAALKEAPLYRRGFIALRTGVTFVTALAGVVALPKSNLMVCELKGPV